MFDPNNPCLFCNSKQSGLAAENEFAYASYDTYPVSEFHCLVIPKRHVRVSGSCGHKSVERETTGDNASSQLCFHVFKEIGDNGRQCEITIVPSCI